MAHPHTTTNERWRTDVDQKIGVLSTKVDGIEVQLQHHGQTLGKIFSSLDELKGKQGPSIGEILRVSVMGVAILGAAGTAVTMLVTSLLSPAITKLEMQGQHHNTVVSQLLDERNNEFDRLKKAERDGLDERLKTIEDRIARMAWAPKVSR